MIKNYLYSRFRAVKKIKTAIAIAMCSFVVMSCSRPDGAAQPNIDLDIQAIEFELAGLEGNDEGFEYSVWLGPPDGQAWYSYNSKAIMPAASAIKTAILVEFFDDKIQTLDQPFVELQALLENPEGQAIAHFTPEKQTSARTELKSLTARQLAEAMIHKQHVETNAAYNAATNVIIEYFGGPQALSERIHQRFPKAHDMVLARYMLADRQKNDDNLLSAQALALVLGELASSARPDKLRAEARSVMWLEKDNMRGDHYYKGGSLSSMPQVRIEAGWWEKDCRASVYVVIAKNPLTANSKPNYDKLRANLAQLSKVVQGAGVNIRGTKQTNQPATHCDRDHNDNQ